MSEYLDAISRLEAPERPPMVKYIQKIPFMEYPQHDSEKDWNRIMAQGRNSRLPKYSISQRFNITQYDLNQSVYNFDLDKTFTTAIGDRKSIAVRNISFSMTDAISDFKLVCSFNMFKDKTIYIDDTITTLLSNVDAPASDVNSKTYNFTNTTQVLNTLADALIEGLKNGFEILKVPKNDLISYVDVDKRKLTVGLNHIRQTTGADAAKLYFFFKCNDLTKDNYLFGKKNTTNWHRVIAAVTNDDVNKCCSCVFDFSNCVQQISTLSTVCSTINPYSIQNIIGSPKEYHDMLNKIYPYDRQNSFQLWFNDEEGNRILNKNITGYLDLELIVDNSNNINLDV